MIEVFMKIRIIPQEYEAIKFNGITKQVEEFLLNSDARIYKNGDDYILSNFVGNHGVNIGDYLYKMNSPLTIVSVVHYDAITSKYFEVIE